MKQFTQLFKPQKHANEQNWVNLVAFCMFKDKQRICCAQMLKRETSVRD